MRKAAQALEHRIDVGHAVAGIVLLHHRVIGGEPEHLGAQRRLLAHQPNHALEGRAECLPVALGTGHAPQLLGIACRVSVWRRTKSVGRQVRLR